MRAGASEVVYVYRGTLDMRMGFDRVAGKIEAECERSAQRGGWYVFFSRTRDRVRIFYWDRDGYAMWTKRLEAGTFKVGRSAEGYEEIAAVDLDSLLSGAELSRIKVRQNAERGLYSGSALDTTER
jgi:transposase